jgi:hypothetical protein
MILYPECQRKAQEEIDKVIGIGRLPEFDDRESLPYVEWLMQEVLRCEDHLSESVIGTYFVLQMASSGASRLGNYFARI